MSSIKYYDLLGLSVCKSCYKNMNIKTYEITFLKGFVISPLIIYSLFITTKHLLLNYFAVFSSMTFCAMGSYYQCSIFQ